MMNRRGFLGATLSSLAIAAATVPAAVAASLPAVTRGYVAGPFGQIHYRLAGASIGVGASKRPPLVFFHQTPTSSLEYEPLMRLMATDRVCLALDTPGYGQSDPPPRPLSIAEYTSALLEAVDGVGPPFRDSPLDLFAFHTGTLFAIEAAVMRPRQVRKLALAGVPYVVGAEREDRYRARVTQAPPPRPSGSRLVDVWHRVVTMRSSQMPYERAEALAYDYIKAGDRYWWAYHGVFSYPSEAQFPKVGQPALLLAVHDSLLENTRRAASVMPKAVLRDLPQLTGEGVLDDGADLIAQALREWLA